MTPFPERYADLAAFIGDGDPTLTRLVSALDRALRARSAPPALHATLERLLQERVSVASALPALPAPTELPARAAAPLSRREALKAGAASMALLLSLNHIGPKVADELARLAQEGPMTGARLAGILQAERGKWNALLAQIGLDRMEEPGVEGDWSAKELVAHLTWYESRIVEGAHQIMSTGRFSKPQTGLTGLPMDERNARIAAASHTRPVGDVLAEADRVFDQLVALVAAIPQAILNDPHLLGLPDDMVPWMAVANNSYAHYKEHEDAVRAWLEAHKRPGAHA